jgi:hypothetical protein
MIFGDGFSYLQPIPIEIFIILFKLFLIGKIITHEFVVEREEKRPLKILMDDDNDMKAWAENQKERKLSPEKINKQLKQVIRGYSYSTFVF